MRPTALADAPVHCGRLRLSAGCRLTRPMTRTLFPSRDRFSHGLPSADTRPARQPHRILLCSLAVLALAGGPGALAAGAPPLSSYAGKYPFDQVEGIAFREHRAVVKGVTAAVSKVPAGADILGHALQPAKSVDTPILPLSGGRLYARSYDPAGGGSTNWAILITADGRETAICFSDDALYGDGVSHWYFEGAEAFTLPGPCPSEQQELEGSIGPWPLGPRPE